MSEEVLSDDQRQAIWDELDTDENPALRENEPPAPAREPEPQAPPAPPPVEVSVADLQAEVGRMKQSLEHRVRNAEGKIGELNDNLRRKEQELATLRAQAQAAPSRQEVAQASESMQDWEQLKTDYPEWARAIDQRLGKAGAGVSEDTLREIERRAGDEIARVRAELSREREDMAREMVEDRHPGWEQVVRTNEFKAWEQQQPPEVRRLAGSPRPTDAIKLLNLFKHGDEYGASSQHQRTAADLARERRSRLSQSAVAPRGSAGRAAVKSEEDMTDAEYWDYLGELDRRKEMGAR